jgi:hypothetical protein
MELVSSLAKVLAAPMQQIFPIHGWTIKELGSSSLHDDGAFVARSGKLEG